MKAIGLLCLYIAMSSLIFGISIRYRFVYDDHVKIDENRSLDDVGHLARTFLDPANQSGDPTLNRHTLRPLFVFIMGVERRIFGNDPSGFRAVNIILHGVNSFLVMCVAGGLFELTLGASAIAGVAFLVHPAQVESVVWIVEQSNLICMSLVLAALLMWIRYCRNRQFPDLLLCFLFFVCGLFVRENAFVFPAAAAAVAFYLDRSDQPKRFYLKPLAVLFGVAVVMFIGRSMILNQTAQSETVSFASQAGIIFSAVVFSLRTMVFPYPITVNHIYAGPQLWMAVLLFVILGIIWTQRKNKSFLLCAALYIVLWFPTAHIVPIAAFFAERFLYAPLAAFAFLQGTLWRKLAWRPCLIGINVIFLILTLTAIPIWRNDVTLWSNAVKTTPANWRAWYNLAASEKIVSGPGYASDTATLNRIKTDLTTALQCSLPSNYGADVFLELAKTELLLGENAGAEENARRAAALNPNMTEEWNCIKASIRKPNVV